MPSYRSVLLTSLLLLSPTTATAEDGEALREAARNGDVAAARSLLASGVEADAADRWGSTALYFAAEKGHAEMVELLLERGARVDLEESFFGSSPLTQALSAGHFEIVERLLEAGAPERAPVLDVALARGDLHLARAAVRSGPLLVSERAELERRHPELEEELARLLRSAETRPDPPPPAYTEAELRRFAGRFENWDGEGDLEEVVVRVEGGRLQVDVGDGAGGTLSPAADSVFRSDDGRLELAFFGRAGTVEGLRLNGGGNGTMTFRRSVAEPTADAADIALRLPEPVARDVRTVHWPGFRGADARGIGDGVDTPTDWDLERGDGLLWQQDLPGLANSSPVVWGDRVFVTTAVAEGGSEPLRTGLTGAGTEIEEAREHRWLVLAFDKRSGEKLWETEVGRGVPLTRRHFKATQANSTPATDGRHLVVVFPTAGLACLDLDGGLRWKRELGGLNAGGFNDPSMQWGYASSPLIYQDRVILQVDIHDGPYLAAWSLENGEQLWRTERPEVAPSWATPVVWSTPDGDEIVANASAIRGYAPDDGRELWSLGPSSVQVVATPVVGRDAVFVGAGYPPVKPIYAVRPGIRGHHEIEPGAEHPHLLWSHDRGGAYMPTPLLYRGLFYVVHHNGRMVAYDAASGAAVYKARFSHRGTFTNSPIAANGKIYTGTEEGLLFVLAAGPEFEEIAVHDFDEPLMATPAVSEGILFVRTPTKLYALSDAEPASRAE